MTRERAAFRQPAYNPSVRSWPADGEESQERAEEQGGDRRQGRKYEAARHVVDEAGEGGTHDLAQAERGGHDRERGAGITRREPAGADQPERGESHEGA